jgi:hypothetical protein
MVRGQDNCQWFKGEFAMLTNRMREIKDRLEDKKEALLSIEERELLHELQFIDRHETRRDIFERSVPEFGLERVEGKPKRKKCPYCGKELPD